MNERKERNFELELKVSSIELLLNFIQLFKSRLNYKACPKDVIKNFTYDTQSIGETLGAGAKSRGGPGNFRGPGPKTRGGRGPPGPPAAPPLSKIQ